MRISDTMKMALKPSSAVLLLFVVLSSLPTALPFAVIKANTEDTVNYASAQQEIVKFESVVNAVINSTFSSSPFAVVQKAKGAYLEGYGVSFAFLINIHRAVINTPFGQVRSQSAVTPELKTRKIEQLKESLLRALQENGEIFQQLSKQDYVTIIAFIEDRNFPDEPSANKTIVLRAQKKDLDELGNSKSRFEEFKQRMKIVEY
jgi:hypothetical protein